MKKVLTLLGGSAAFAMASSAYPADLPTRKLPVAPPAGSCYASFWSWLNASAADCPLSYWGVTFYGQIDVGGGYNTHASAFNASYPNGIFNNIQSTSHNGAWQAIPNGLSQSNIGVKWREQIASQWYIVGDVNFGFDPYSLHFSDGPNSLLQNNTLPLFARSTDADSSRAYGLINARAYAGIQNQTFGTLTYGRQYAFSTENDAFYDPFGGAYAFSLIGTSSTIGAGLGVTETARYTNSIKYVYNDRNVRAGVISQVGGWSAGNNAKYAIQGDVGFDFYGLSADGVYSYARDAVNLSVLGASGTGLLPAGVAPDTLKATIQNDSAFQIAAKYKWQQLTIYGGYQNEYITNPSNLPTGTNIRNFNDGYLAEYGTAVQDSTVPGLPAAVNATFNNAFPVPKILQVVWIGGKYAILPNLDLAAGYYRYWQNDYLGATQTATGASSCTANTGVNPTGNNGGKLYGTMSSKCAGVENAFSGLIDWRPVKRVDVYGGFMYSNISGGLASGYYANNNLEGVAGIRVSF